MHLFDKNLNQVTSKLLTPILRLIPAHITPNIITICGGVISLIASIIFSSNNNLNLLILSNLFCVIFDILDGALARFRREESGFGQKIDILTDIFITIILILMFSFKFYIFEFLLAVFLIFLYFIRILFILKDLDSGIGGFRSPILILIVFNYLSGLKYVDWIIYILIIWNLVSVLISSWKIKKLAKISF